MRDRILAVYDTLRPSERRLADYVARHGASVIRLTMPELAERAGAASVNGARPLAKNAYKIPLTRGVVRRALLEAAGA